jgi:hypothetical protein
MEYREVDESSLVEGIKELQKAFSTYERCLFYYDESKAIKNEVNCDLRFEAVMEKVYELLEPNVEEDETYEEARQQALFFLTASLFAYMLRLMVQFALGMNRL